MKLKDLFESAENKKIIEDWLKQFSHFIYLDGLLIKQEIDNIFDFQTMKLESEVTSFCLIGDGGVKFSWPLAESPLRSDFILDLSGGVPGGMIIDDFEQFPKMVPKLSMTDMVTIKSFRGIDKLTKLRVISIDTESMIVDCGLLRLLKIPSLKRIVLNRRDDTKNKFDSAMSIVFKHFEGDREVAECQQELIEAGLQEYAKL